MSFDLQAGHYDMGGIEVFDIVEAKPTKDQYLGYLLGNLIKYSCRANVKGQLNSDLSKALYYSKKFKELTEETEKVTHTP